MQFGSSLVRAGTLRQAANQSTMLLLQRTFVSAFFTSSATRSLPLFLNSTPKVFTRRNMASQNDSQAVSSDSPPSQTLRVALCQFLVTEDKSTNLETCSTFVDRAAASKADLVVLPEIWNSPYATAAFPDYAEDLASEITSDSPSRNLLQSKAREHQIWIVGGSIPEKTIDDNKDTRYYNTCLVIDPNGSVVAQHRKVHLFDIDVPNGIRFCESDTLSPGSSVTTFDMHGIRLGVGICYDIRFPEYALLLRHQRGCHILVYPGAFNLTTGPAHWELLQRARAVDTQCFVLTASPARSPPAPSKYPPYSAWGHSTVVAPWGTVLATTGDGEDVVVADLDMGLVKEMRQGIPVAEQKRKDLYRLEDVTME